MLNCESKLPLSELWIKSLFMEFLMSKIWLWIGINLKNTLSLLNFFYYSLPNYPHHSRRNRTSWLFSPQHSFNPPRANNAHHRPRASPPKRNKDQRPQLPLVYLWKMSLRKNESLSLLFFFNKVFEGTLFKTFYKPPLAHRDIE